MHYCEEWIWGPTWPKNYLEHTLSLWFINCPWKRSTIAPEGHGAQALQGSRFGVLKGDPLNQGYPETFVL